MHGERALMLPVFENPAFVAQQGMPPIPGRALDALYFSEHMGRIVAISIDDLNLFIAGLKEEDRTLQMTLDGGPVQQLDTRLTQMLAPAVSGGGDAFFARLSSIAWRRLVKVFACMRNAMASSPRVSPISHPCNSAHSKSIPLNCFHQAVNRLVTAWKVIERWYGVSMFNAIRPLRLQATAYRRWLAARSRQ